MDATKIMRANVVKTIGLVLTVFFVTLPAVVLGKDDRWEIAPGVFMPQVAFLEEDILIAMLRL